MLRWFVVGLIVCSPVIVLTGPFLYTYTQIEPVCVSLVVLTVVIIVSLLLIVMSKWSRYTKEAIAGGMLGSCIGTICFWIVVWSHPR